MSNKNKIQSIVDAGPCRELEAIMRDNIFMFAETIGNSVIAVD